MDTLAQMVEELSEDARVHVRNVAENLQLAADLGYGDVALLVPGSDGALVVIADARPMTAGSAIPTTRVGRVIDRDDEPEAYDTLTTGAPSCDVKRRTRRGIAFSSTAYPVGGDGRPYAILVRHLGQAVSEAPGKMEVAFMRLAQLLLERLQRGPIRDIDTEEPYATTRLAGDGVLEIDATGAVVYASPNAVNTMRLAGMESQLVGGPASALPGGALAVAPVIGTDGAREKTVNVQGRSLRYRTVALADRMLVLVEDVTDAVRREQELHVKEMAIREVHHRVKNNLQTIASLLRIQARRSSSDEAARALEEAVERVSSMAVVHEMLASSTDESVDLAAAVSTVVDMVRRGLTGADSGIRIAVDGATGLVPAQVATSLALVAAELVHNAIEHGVGPAGGGDVTVFLARDSRSVSLTVRDSGGALPDTFQVESSAHLGLAIVKTVAEDDLRGTLSFRSGAETVISVTVPIDETD
ncbi:sensor histidine kinase [Anaerosoma tenue]|uniref:sensor histidine kinase n=1 Tax=Anaerosoma tenue TaxID=2933588 RepID=UPI002260BE8D|nr:histidine kinase N-terminal domain-containing protein [Anaerosoma tenue]MCK8115420.1 sensor histidine kinase [Anaerosoma tenue]